MILGRGTALRALGDALAGVLTILLLEEGPVHPLRRPANAGAAVDSARGALEIEVGDPYRDRSDGWLVVDGTLAVSPSGLLMPGW